MYMFHSLYCFFLLSQQLSLERHFIKAPQNSSKEKKHLSKSNSLSQAQATIFLYIDKSYSISMHALYN